MKCILEYKYDEINNYYHNPNITDGKGNTVEDYFKLKGRTVPDEWKTY